MTTSTAKLRQAPSQSSPYVTQLKQRAVAWAVKLRVNPKVIRVQGMRRKWGSCSSAGTVTLAADLAEQDERFQDYVIVHELLHLRLSTHGRVFKAIMNAHLPGWRTLTRNPPNNRRLTGRLDARRSGSPAETTVGAPDRQA